MRHFSCILSTTLLLLLLTASCGQGHGKSHDYDQVVYQPKYAQGYRLLGAEGSESLILESINPWQGAENVSSALFLSRNGEEAPNGFQGQVLKAAPKRIVCMSSTHVGMLEALGASDRIVGVSGIGYISNPYVNAHRDTIADVGYDSGVDYEKIMSLRPDLVIIYSVSGASLMEPKLKELGIPYVYIGEYMEENPLGKAEWMVAMAEILGGSTDGIGPFKPVEENYLRLKELAKKGTSKPKVMLNTPYGDQWVMPSVDNYTVQLINDAGGQYMYSRNHTGRSVPIDMEEAYLMASEADLWLNVGQIRSLKELAALCPRFVDTRVYRDGDIWNTTLRSTPGGGNDYWETGVARPDLVLADLIAIFHPELGLNDLYFYERLK